MSDSPAVEPRARDPEAASRTLFALIAATIVASACMTSGPEFGSYDSAGVQIVVSDDIDAHVSLGLSDTPLVDIDLADGAASGDPVMVR